MSGPERDGGPSYRELSTIGSPNNPKIERGIKILMRSVKDHVVAVQRNAFLLDDFLELRYALAVCDEQARMVAWGAPLRGGYGVRRHAIQRRATGVLR